MKKIIFILLFIATLFAQDLSNLDPTFHHYSARATGMGNAYTAMQEAPLSIFYNPAGILSDRQNIAFSNTNFLNLISYNYFGYSQNLGKDFTGALGITYSGDNAFQEYAIYASFAKKFDFYSDLIGGINVKYLGASFGGNDHGELIDDEGYNHQVDGFANGFGIDFGVQYELDKFNRLGAFWRNPLNFIFWHSENEVETALGDYEEGQPSNLIFGYAFSNNNFSGAIDFNKSYHSDTEDIFAIGGEYHIYQKMMAMRCGYSQEILTAKNRKYSFGLGFNFKAWQAKKCNLDISYEVQTEWQKHNAFKISCGLQL
ncbi:MAG: hypothetical protein HN952_06815 [Candidatus Cloacimonetes bacterium]|jgi:hypothetical protein|nr:hypothetical protein [Candidatus Cloacimonadota bacterium]MBT6994645.1 hypothetical protein [Candidatus Cloacimonadota bacterium]MBT7469415.1 hypothetical protein [Candidatus Cloacimonadota bacterium]